MSDLRPNATPPSTGFDLNRPTIVGLLYLAGAVTGGLAGIVGLVLAIVWKGEAHEPWEATHYTYLIRTFIIAFAASIVGVVLLIVLIGFPIIAAAGLWALVRTVLSLVNAQKRAAMPNPESWLF